jgi:hypothetical protein
LKINQHINLPSHLGRTLTKEQQVDLQEFIKKKEARDVL